MDDNWMFLWAIPLIVLFFLFLYLFLKGFFPEFFSYLILIQGSMYILNEFVPITESNKYKSLFIFGMFVTLIIMILVLLTTKRYDYDQIVVNDKGVRKIRKPQMDSLVM